MIMFWVWLIVTVTRNWDDCNVICPYCGKRMRDKNTKGNNIRGVCIRCHQEFTYWVK